jgi:hypothetical protein
MTLFATVGDAKVFQNAADPPHKANWPATWTHAGFLVHSIVTPLPWIPLAALT